MVLPLLALILSLGAAATLSLRPWEDDSLTPNLELAPDLGVSLDEAVPLPSVPEIDVSVGQIAHRSRLVSSPALAGGPKAEAAPRIAIASNQVVLAAAPVAPPSTPLAPPELMPPPAMPVAAPAAPPAEPPTARPPTRIIAELDGGAGGWRSVVDGDATPPGVAAVQIHEGDEYAFAFSFEIVRMAYGEPGADNRIMRLRSDGVEEPAFGLQLWDDVEADPEGGLRGIWASGEEMGGDRFLAPVSEGAWHTAVVHFLASSQGTGFYEVYLDGVLIDARNGASLIVPGSEFAQLELGLFRDPDLVQGSSEVRFNAVKLGESLDSLQP